MRASFISILLYLFYSPVYVQHSISLTVSILQVSFIFLKDHFVLVTKMIKPDLKKNLMFVLLGGFVLWSLITLGSPLKLLSSLKILFHLKFSPKKYARPLFGTYSLGKFLGQIQVPSIS